MKQLGTKVSESSAGEIKKEAVALLSDLVLSTRYKAILGFTVALTISSGQVQEDDMLPLREAGLSDAEISALVMIVACFAFMNRIADGTGVALQEEQWPLALELFGAQELRNHQIWAAGT